MNTKLVTRHKMSMWRKLFICVGEFLKGKFFVNSLLVVYGTYGGGYIIVNIFIGAIDSPKPPLQVAIEIFKIFIWLFLFLIITYLFFQGLGSLLISIGKYYPNWYYFPKIKVSANISPDNEIVISVSNPKKRQNMSLRAVYSKLDSDVKPLPIQASGVAPDTVKQLLPLSSMNGKCSRKEKIGKIDNGTVTLSAGKGNSDIQLTKPGIYHYYINLLGKFRGRGYGGHAKIVIKITENHEIKIEE